MVEVLGAYSRMSSDLGRVGSLLARSAVTSPSRDVSAGQKQVRLSHANQLVLVESYRDGATLVALARQFGIHKRTAAEILARHGVPRRGGRVALDLDEIAHRYEGGESLAQLGKQFGVDAETIRTAMIRAGIPTRPRRGR